MIKSKLRSIGPLYKLYGFYKFAAFPIRVIGASLLDRLADNGRDHLSIPPPRLRYRVHGSLGKDRFLSVGEQCAADIRAMLKSENLELGSFRDILDFGCGCARVLRFFLQEKTGSRFQGTDIDPELIQWCKKNLGEEDFDVNPHLPPTKYGDATFDFIYSISVFTHLNEEMQFSWLKELRRIVRPGGHLLLSFHGPTSYTHLPQAQQQVLAEKGFIYFKGQTGLLKLDGLPDFYQSAYHNLFYIKEQWGRYFEIVKHFEKGINAHQDAVLLKAGTAPVGH